MSGDDTSLQLNYFSAGHKRKAFFDREEIVKPCLHTIARSLGAIRVERKADEIVLSRHTVSRRAE